MASNTGTRPTYITILAVLSVLVGVFSIFGGLAVFGMGGLAYYGLGVPALWTLMGLVFVVMGIADIALGYGFWTTKEWAWQGAAIYQGAYVIVAVLRLLVGGGSITDVLVSIVFGAIVLYYLNMPKVRELFKAPEKGFPIVGVALDPAFAKVDEIINQQRKS